MLSKSPARQPSQEYTETSSLLSGSSLTERQSLSWQSSAQQERQLSATAIMRDGIIGFADGLTVPFALTAGLSSIGSSRLVIIGGLAELFAGAISMGLGGYLATVTETRAYRAKEQRERKESLFKPEAEEGIFEVFDNYGLSRDVVAPMVENLKKDPDMWLKFRMDFELQIEKPNSSQAWISALTLSLSYFLGGLIPMIPYFAIPDVTQALFVSIAITVLILLIFGYVKAIYTGTSQVAAFCSAIETLAVGAAAAGASWGIVSGVNSIKPVEP